METTEASSWSFPTIPETEYSLNHGSAVCDWYNICTRVVFGGLLVIVGIIGNSLTLVVMFADRKKSSTILVLFYLAMTDLLILIVYGFMVVPTPLLSFMNQDRLANHFQLISITYISYVGRTINQISIFLTIIVSWQRYVSVCHPHKAKFHSNSTLINRQVAVAVTFSLVFYLPSYFQGVIHFNSDGDMFVVKPAFGQDAAFLLLYSVILCYLASYVIPMVALTLMTFKLIQALRNTKMKVAAMNVQVKKPREELTRTLVIVVIIFMICQSIGPIRRVLMWVYDPYPQAVKCGQSLFFFGPFVMLSLLLNSAANFGVYVLCAKRFRAKVKKLLMPEKRVIDQPEGNHVVRVDCSQYPEGRTLNSRF